MQDRERSILWIIRCIALFTIRKKTGKPFKDGTKQDIRSFLKWMEQKGYKSSTNEKFRQILKLLFKIVCGNEGEYHPDQVKWFSVKLGKEKVGKDTSMDMSEYLQEEVQKLIESATTLQKKTFLACMYESGARPEEFLRITNRDLRIDKDGVPV